MNTLLRGNNPGLRFFWGVQVSLLGLFVGCEQKSDTQIRKDIVAARKVYEAKEGHDKRGQHFYELAIAMTTPIGAEKRAARTFSRAEILEIFGEPDFIKSGEGDFEMLYIYKAKNTEHPQSVSVRFISDGADFGYAPLDSLDLSKYEKTEDANPNTSSD